MVGTVTEDQDNCPSVIVPINLCMRFGRDNKFYGAVAGDRKNLLNQYSDQRRKY